MAYNRSKSKGRGYPLGKDNEMEEVIVGTREPGGLYKAPMPMTLLFNWIQRAVNLRRNRLK